MNSFSIMWHLFKMQLSNTWTNIKHTFKPNAKLHEKPCYVTEAKVVNYDVINLLNQIKVIDYQKETVFTFKNIPEIFEEYNSIKTVFTSTLIQNALLKIHEDYPDYFVYVENIDPKKLIVKIHLLNKKIFKELFVIPEQKDEFDELITNKTISIRMVTQDGNNYVLSIQTLVEGEIQQAKTIRVLSSFKSILDIVESHQDLTLYLLNETFINKVVHDLPESNDDILDVIISGKSFDEFILINKIL